MFLFSVLNIFITLIIIILLLRYFAERYRYYGFGPIMVAVISITEKMVKPLRRLLPQASLKLQDQIPLIAIAVVLFIRGLIIFLLGSAGTYPLPMYTSSAIGTNFLTAQAMSFTMGVTLVSQLLIFLLFASMMVSKRGIMSCGTGGFVCFQERTFAVFNFAKRFYRSENLVHLFVFSALAIWILGAVLATITSLSWLAGGVAMQHTFIRALLEIITGVLYYYMLVLILAILTTWIGADQFSLVVQVVKAMSDPYLSFFRRLAPWARIDFVDLSPIFAFLTLMIFIMFLQAVMHSALI